ncbi:hypothetical protein JOC95_003917 [Bacillus tianshenii]|uniref:Secreted protein n=1 Tax=Sutcliffiella tianshenii TaxID=1463404 RepID=A0ABS2P560_9BACI|nr:hypothetical protein [Bacillus tianshenii]
MLVFFCVGLGLGFGWGVVLVIDFVFFVVGGGADKCQAPLFLFGGESGWLVGEGARHWCVCGRVKEGYGVFCTVIEGK